MSPDDASTSRAQSGRSRVETTGDIADPAVDRVVPPEGQGPTLVVWREYGFRRDRVQNNLLIAAVWVAVLVVYLLAESGLRAPSGGELAIGLVPAVGAMLLMQWLTSSPGRFVAAGDVWLATGQTKKPPRPCRRWVRLDDLIGVTIAHRRRFASDTPEYHFEDRDGRRLVVPVRSVRSSPPLQELVAEAVLAHRRHLAGAAELETALRAPADAAGRTTVRSAS